MYTRHSFSNSMGKKFQRTYVKIERKDHSSMVNVVLSMSKDLKSLENLVSQPMSVYEDYFVLYST